MNPPVLAPSTASSADHEAQRNLLDLPAEIRQEIYRHLCFLPSVLHLESGAHEEGCRTRSRRIYFVSRNRNSTALHPFGVCCTSWRYSKVYRQQSIRVSQVRKKVVAATMESPGSHKAARRQGLLTSISISSLPGWIGTSNTASSLSLTHFDESTTTNDFFVDFSEGYELAQTKQSPHINLLRVNR
jgi:hypothetical protein